jgi:hypothetical protein
MTLTTEEFGDVADVDAGAMDEVLEPDAFGKFAVLSASDEAFIQAGNDWQPGPECKAYLAAHGSDPWLLEYREAGRQFRAAGHVTLDQVREAFASYLAGRSTWRTDFAWSEMEL